MFVLYINLRNRDLRFAINPLVPSVLSIGRLDNIFISILEGILKRISYERRDNESVDEKSLYILSYVTKNDEKKNPGKNGYNKHVPSFRYVKTYHFKAVICMQVPHIDSRIKIKFFN